MAGSDSTMIEFMKGRARCGKVEKYEEGKRDRALRNQQSLTQKLKVTEIIWTYQILGKHCTYCSSSTNANSILGLTQHRNISLDESVNSSPVCAPPSYP